MPKSFVLLIAILLSVSCQQNIDTEALKQEVFDREIEFSDYAGKYGVKAAFIEFAHEEAVIKRQNKIVSGLEAIGAYYENQTYLKSELQWRPDFVDVAESGDLAYTWGKYTFNAVKADSTEVNSTGVFHTVWKRDKNGDWKYVYD